MRTAINDDDIGGGGFHAEFPRTSFPSGSDKEKAPDFSEAFSYYIPMDLCPQSMHSQRETLPSRINLSTS